mgnify:CR=1 FL=1|jgi:glycerophosphoryl diester phosphodiesterase
MKFRPLLFIACLPIAFCLPSLAQQRHCIKTRSEKDLQEFFRYTGKDAPLISGHRGCQIEGYPENSIESMEYTLRHTPAFFEIDPRLTKDSVIVLLHDATLDRTTTGTGKLSDYTWEEVKQLKLKDKYGNVTPYRIPTLEEAINWARGKTILNLDKKDVPFEMIAAIIRRLNAGSFVMVTVHNAKQAKFYYDDDPNRMMSAHIKTEKAMREFEKAGIPWKNMIVYLGPENKPEIKQLYDSLHARGVMCFLSAAPKYDKLSTPEERAEAYREVFRQGADILETDLPVEAAAAVKDLWPKKKRKQKFFKIEKM